MISKKIQLLLFGALLCNQLVRGDQVFDILKYGAKSDGIFKNTEAIAKAIEAASAAGGGTVYFPVGHYLTGPIHFKSNVSIYLADGVVVKFSDDFDDYLPMVRVRWEGTELMSFSPLIYGDKVSNIGLYGNATLDGSGEKWWNFSHHIRQEHNSGNHNATKWQVEFHKANAELLNETRELYEHLSAGFLRPQFFSPVHSDHITLQGLTFINSPFWTVTPAFSDYITIDGLTIRNPQHSPNTDGIDPDSCRFVTISNCDIDVGDDCVCIKSGKDIQGRQLNRPSENITVTDSIMRRGHGGIVIGSEMSGSVRNIYASNLHFEGTDRGIRIKSTRGRGGVVENVHIQDVTMHGLSHEGITINTQYTNTPEEPLSERTPVFRNIYIANVTGDSVMSIQITGLPEKHFENIELVNVHLVSKYYMITRDVDNLELTNTTVLIV